MKDLAVILEDKPGALADLGDATGGANINIEGMCATTAGGKGVVVEVQDRPGTMAAVARKLGDAGVNIGFAYTTFSGVKLVLGVDDLDKARAAG
jgi:hypothetical protein